MKREYNSVELNIVHISAHNIIITSPTMDEGSRGVVDFGKNWSTVSDGTILGYGED